MAGMMRFDPFRELTRFDPFRNLDDVFKEFALTPSLRGVAPEPRIRMDVTDAGDSYLVKADIPGVKKENIKVTIEGNSVSISATSSQEKETKEGDMVCSERYYGEQFRNFTVPAELDDAKVEARYQDGVLQLKLPKKEVKASRQVTIQ